MNSGYMLSNIGYRGVSHSSVEILIIFVYQTFYIKILENSARIFWLVYLLNDIFTLNFRMN